jgi:Skp family chaperone for outer membrane proteins
MSGMSRELEARMKKNEEECERLRADLHAKEEKLRAGLKVWDKLSRESEAMALRSELSERHVRTLAGEGVGGSAF